MCMYSQHADRTPCLRPPHLQADVAHAPPALARNVRDPGPDRDVLQLEHAPAVRLCRRTRGRLRDQVLNRRPARSARRRSVGACHVGQADRCGIQRPENKSELPKG